MSDQPAGDPCTIVIFGASGDLTKRKLLPALVNLRTYGLLPKDFAIIGVARNTAKLDPGVWADFEKRVYYCDGEFGNPETYTKLAALLAKVGPENKTRENVLFYLATPPAVFAEVVEHLGAAGLTRSDKGWRRVVVEKPFGRDLDSARELNRQLTSVLSEKQIFRIDHYLGKETVQNLLVFRLANGIFEPIWDRRYIENVQITVAEELGVEDRGGYYESAGVLRDMIQNHMFQLMTLVTMEPPSSLEAEAVRNEKVKVLESIKPMDGETIIHDTVRGQYGEGVVKGEKVPAYRSEAKVSPKSNTETFAALKLGIENWRWAGVPFYLRSGKRLATRDSRIVINFRKPPLHLFKQAGLEAVSSNRLIIQVQPNEGIRLHFKAKVPGPSIQVKTVQLEFDYDEFGERSAATGYERLLYDAMTGDSTLFHRKDMVEAAWRVIDPILDVWRSLPPRDFPNYAAGTWGPQAADQLLARDARQWRTPTGGP